MNNPYYEPEDLGLETIGSIDDAGSYEFNTLAAWKDKKTGEVYWQEDAGCSCPTPFESFNTLQSLNKITTPQSFEAFAQRADDWDLPQHEIDAFVEKVRKAWNNWKRRRAQKK